MVDRGYFDSINKIIQNSTDKYGVDEEKAIVLINLHDKYLNKILNEDNIPPEEEFIKEELSNYKTGNDYDYQKVYLDSKEENKYFNSAEKLQLKGEEEFNSIVADRFVFKDKPDYAGANTIIGYYEGIPEIFKSKYLTQLKNMSKVNNKIFMNESKSLHDQITSWNFDNDEVLIMDKDKIPQKVVITNKAKQELYESVGENLNQFDYYYKKFTSAAQNRTGSKGGQGIKTVVGKDFDAEIKILGNGGRLRMYSRPVTSYDQVKYSSDDGINVKYIFDTCDGHL